MLDFDNPLPRFGQVRLGEVKTPDMGLYYGEIGIDQKPHGRGICVHIDRRTRIGYWENGTQANGMGIDIL